MVISMNEKLDDIKEKIETLLNSSDKGRPRLRLSFDRSSNVTNKKFNCKVSYYL